MAEHTPGPWGGGGGRAMPITAKINGIDRQIGEAQDCHGLIPDDEVVANVLLMRAAPDLLAALEAMLEAEIYAEGEGLHYIARTDVSDSVQAVAAARAAIHKATGK